MCRSMFVVNSRACFVLLVLVLCGGPFSRTAHGRPVGAGHEKPGHQYRRSLQGAESLEQWLGVGHHHLRKAARHATNTLGLTQPLVGRSSTTQAGDSAQGAAGGYGGAGTQGYGASAVPQFQGLPATTQQVPPAGGPLTYDAPSTSSNEVTDVNAAASGYFPAGTPGQGTLGALGSALGLGESKVEQASKEAAAEAELGEEATLAQSGALNDVSGPPSANGSPAGAPGSWWAVYGAPPGVLQDMLTPPGVTEALEEEGVSKEAISEALDPNKRTVPPAPPNGCLVDCELEWKGREVKRAQSLTGGLQALAEEEAALGRNGLPAPPAKDPCEEAKELAKGTTQEACTAATAANEQCMTPVKEKAAKGKKAPKVDTTALLANCAKSLKRKQRACKPLEDVKTMCAAKTARAEHKKNKKKKGQ